MSGFEPCVAYAGLLEDVRYVEARRREGRRAWLGLGLGLALW